MDLKQTLIFYRKILLSFLAIVSIAIVIILLYPKIFDGVAPKISFEIARPSKADIFYSLDFATKNENIKDIPKIWNTKGEIFVTFSDNDGIKRYEISIYEIINNQKTLLIKKEDVPLHRPKNIKMLLPKAESKSKDGILRYEIKATDWSNANLFSGESTEISFDIQIDKVTPKVDILAMSPKIVRGGSAMVIFKAKDEHLQDVFVSNGEDNFQVFKYAYDKLEDVYYYASIFAWPLKNNLFEASAVAIDFAGNRTIAPLEMDRQINISRRKSNLTLKQNFLEGKLLELLSQIGQKQISDFSNNIERFKYLNEDIRIQDDSKVFSALSQIGTNKNYIDKYFEPFTPMKNAKIVGYFGDARTYIYEKENISQSNHMGIDLASVKRAPIYASNNGIILLQERLGLYGNTILLYHGLGLSSIYSHLTDFQVALGDEIHTGMQIARSGSTGWAFGDHLHFGILVHGHAVSVNEWTNMEWIQANIIDVLLNANEYLMAKNIEILE